jgi:CRP/FNR family transcriptional regulator, cyclic AMP receptor protein
MNLFRHAAGAAPVSAGLEICRQGDPGNTMFAIVDGSVEILRGGRVLETLGPGEFFGEMSLIDGSPRSATARAKTDCKIVAIDEKQFGFMVQQTPFFALEVIRVLVTRLRHRLQEQSSA